MIGHAGLLYLLPCRMRRYKESKLWCQVCMPLQYDSPHPTIEARPCYWWGLQPISGVGAQAAFSRALSTSDVKDASMVWDNFFTIVESHAFWKRCNCWSGVLADERELHIASIETRSWYGTLLCDDGKIDCWRLCVDVAEAKNADVASMFAHLIPSPPSFTGRVAWIPWILSKTTLRLVERHDLRMVSNYSRSGWL